jgi:hypothetical protein
MANSVIVTPEPVDALDDAELLAPPPLPPTPPVVLLLDPTDTLAVDALVLAAPPPVPPPILIGSAAGFPHPTGIIAMRISESLRVLRRFIRQFPYDSSVAAVGDEIVRIIGTLLFGGS